MPSAEELQEANLGGGAASAAGDWAALPPDPLRSVFTLLLPPAEQPGPLVDVARQWLSLHLTCRAWAAALDEVPLAVVACVPIPAALPWLHRHASTLRLQQDPPVERRRAAEEVQAWAQKHCGPLIPSERYNNPALSAQFEFPEYIRQLSVGRPWERWPAEFYHYEFLHFPLLGAPPPVIRPECCWFKTVMPMLQLSAMGRLQCFREHWRFKVLLSGLAPQCVSIKMDAEVLHLGRPPLNLEVYLSDDLSPVLDALGEALGSPQVLCSLTVWAGAYFVLPTGAVVPAQLLVAGGEARQQLGQRCRGAEVDLVEGDDTHWLVLSWPAAAEQH